MILQRLRPAQGTCFSWLPVWTPEGKVWLEYVHYKWTDTEFGGYTYSRFLTIEDYDAGRRAKSSAKAYETDAQGRAYFGMGADRYATPPNAAACGKLRTDGPTPCHYPHCTCMGYAACRDACNTCDRNTGYVCSEHR